MSNAVKMAVVGLGIMGKSHIRDIIALENTELVAVCDMNSAVADEIAAETNTTAYYHYPELLHHPGLQAVLIATPHFDHPTMSIAALEKGLHVLVEKPIAVQVKDANRMLTAYETAQQQHPNLVFSIVFMQRTYGYWREIKRMIDDGALGRLVRTTWLITDWFRNQSYYNLGGWRATWRGEGGGVLMNQAPHNLDLYQWLVGMPKRVMGFAAEGKYHTIEVEDEVTAYFEHENGMIGHFITSTAESPGTNRLEIVGENGKLIYENGKLLFFRNERSMFAQIQDAPGGFDKVRYEQIEVPFEHHGQAGHRLIIENFANAILHDEPLIVPAQEGIHSLMLSNAIVYSSAQRKMLDLPLDDDDYAAYLQHRMAASSTK